MPFGLALGVAGLILFLPLTAGSAALRVVRRVHLCQAAALRASALVSYGSRRCIPREIRQLRWCGLVRGRARIEF